MKTVLAVCLVCAILCEIFCTLVNISPTIAKNETVPVTTKTVRLQMPNCYFNELTFDCAVKKDCLVWLVASLTSEKDKYSTQTVLYPYTDAYTPTGSKMHTLFVSTLDQLPCPAPDNRNLLVGLNTNPCFQGYCDGELPESENMSFMYILTTYTKLIGQTKWIDIPLKNRQMNPGSLSSNSTSSFVGRSLAMIVITSVLSALIGFILLLFFITITLLCCCGKKKHKLQNIDGSLCKGSYNVHQLKEPEPK